jgi:hypothetical protein
MKAKAIFSIVHMFFGLFAACTAMMALLLNIPHGNTDIGPALELVGGLAIFFWGCFLWTVRDRDHE